MRTKHEGKHVSTVNPYPIRSRKLSRGLPGGAIEDLQARRRQTEIDDMDKRLELYFRGTT